MGFRKEGHLVEIYRDNLPAEFGEFCGILPAGRGGPVRKYFGQKLAAGLLVLGLILSGCSPSKFQLAMYDAEDKVLMAADSFLYKKGSKTVLGNHYTASFDSFTGADTLWDSLDEAAAGQVTIQGSADITDGAFKLVLISESGVTVFYEASEGETDFSYTADLSVGRWRVKMVGREAAGSFEIQLPGKPS